MKFNQLSTSLVNICKLKQVHRMRRTENILQDLETFSCLILVNMNDKLVCKREHLMQADWVSKKKQNEMNSNKI